MNRLMERMLRQVKTGDEINFIVSGKEFADALVLKIDGNLLMIRDKYGFPWVISMECISAYGFEGMEEKLDLDEQLDGIVNTDNDIKHVDGEIIAQSGQSEEEGSAQKMVNDFIPSTEAENVLDARIMADRVESAEMPQWFTVNSIKNEIITLLYGYPAYLGLIDDIFGDMEQLYAAEGTDRELIAAIAEKIDELEQESQGDTQSDCKSCCEIMRALLYYKLGRVKYAVSVLVREEVRKPAADLARELGEKYWKAIAGYIIRYNYTDALLTEDDRQCVLYYARNCRNELDAQTLYRGANNKYNNPDLAFQGALLYLIKKRPENVMAGDVNTEDFVNILDAFSDAWGPFFIEDMHEQEETLRELVSYKEKVNLKETSDVVREVEKSASITPAKKEKAEDALVYFHAPVVGIFKMNTPYSQYWVDFHPMDSMTRQEMMDKDLYLNPSQVIDPLLIRHFSNLSTFDLKLERFSIVFYVGMNVRGSSAAGAFLSRESRKKVLDLYRERKKYPDLKENEITSLSPIVPVSIEQVKNEYKNSAARCQSASNDVDHADASVFNFLNNALLGKKPPVEVPDPLRRYEELGSATNELLIENDSKRKITCWYKVLQMVFKCGDSSLIDMLEGYAIGLPESNNYHCNFKMLTKIKKGKL